MQSLRRNSKNLFNVEYNKYNNNKKMQLFKQKENKTKYLINFKVKLSFAEKLNKYFISAFDEEYSIRKDRETLMVKSN